MKDILGREIKVGQIVAYPVRQSSSMWMSYGEVKEIGEKTIKVMPSRGRWGTQPLGKLATTSRIDRVVIAKEAA